MKYRINRIGVLFGCLVAGGAGLVSCLAAGCGGDDTIVNAPDGGDATAGGDARADTNPSPDAPSQDAAVDTSVAVDANMFDANGFVDTGAMADAPPLQGFPSAVDQAYCTRLQQCCLVPNGSWDPNCGPELDGVGGIIGIWDHNAALDGGHVTYDAAAAGTCLNYLLSLNCGVVPSAAVRIIRDLCFGAMQGTLGPDGGCVDALECQAGLYCRLAADGGAGNCTALQGQGQPCTDITLSTDCTYLGNGTPALYCAPNPDGGGATCQPALPLDAGCSVAAACQSWSCNYPICDDSFVFSDPGVPNGTCASFTIVDAGGGG
jgi:hypothetical protein